MSVPMLGGGVVSRVQADAVAQAVCPPCGGVVCRGQAQHPPFVPTACFTAGSLDVAVNW